MLTDVLGTVAAKGTARFMPALPPTDTVETQTGKVYYLKPRAHH